VLQHCSGLLSRNSQIIFSERIRNNLNDNIKLLTQRGLRAEIQKALDIVRVLGNNAVHPGQIDLKDNSQIASRLFSLINIITEEMITQPKEIAALYEDLPENEKKKIEKRNGTRPDRISS
jgi:hypothetical protein